MIRYALGVLLLCGALSVYAAPSEKINPAADTAKTATPPLAAALVVDEPSTKPLEDGPVVVYKSKDKFDTVVENLQTAITNRGLLVSKVLYVSDMLNRTGGDLGVPNPVYINAKSVEFCSAVISHRMIQESHLNLVVCPFTIAVFVKTTEPDQVYVAFRKQIIAGNKPELVEIIHEMLHGIVRETIEMEW